MNPVPLTDPTGTIRAWMCGCCLHVGIGSVPIYRSADDDYIEGGKLRAAACCVCWDCRGPNPRTDRISCLRCRACEAKREEAAKTERAERERTHVPCVACDGDGLDDNGEDCMRCNGYGLIPREAAAR